MEKSTAGFIGRQKKPGEKKRYGRGVIKENMQIYALMLPTLVLIFIFCYIPMYGLVIAFQDYVPGAPFLGEGVKWVGLRWFDKFISGHYFSRLIKNTLILSGLNLLFGFTAPIFFALLLDQIKHTRFKKIYPDGQLYALFHFYCGSGRHGYLVHRHRRAGNKSAYAAGV